MKCHENLEDHSWKLSENQGHQAKGLSIVLKCGGSFFAIFVRKDWRNNVNQTRQRGR